MISLGQEAMQALMDDYLDTQQSACNFDTLDDVEDVYRVNNQMLDAKLFSNWKQMVGFVIHGPVNLQWPTQMPWGDTAMQLTPTETLKLRVYPKGAIHGQNMGGIIMVATRITDASGAAKVSIAFLWKMHHTAFPDVDIAGGGAGVRTMSCRNCHFLLPSVFGHHDASVTESRPLGMKRYVVLDKYNYHAIKPSAFTVTNVDSVTTCSTTPGMSTYVVAGELVGVEVEDTTKRSAEQVKYRNWQMKTSAAMHTIESKVGPEICTDAQNEALTLLDALCPEGVVSMLHHAGTDGALPDMMHRPGGLPLFIVASLRIAAYPERYKDLCMGTLMDQCACEELSAMFEANWEPVVTDPGKHWAIDVALRQGLNDARAAAAKEGVQLAVADNLLFAQRAGQRCIASIFGSVERTDNPTLRSRGRFGYSSLVNDPLDEAKQRVLLRQGLMDPRPTGEAMTLRLAHRNDLRAHVVRMMNTVEEWLRTGCYAGFAINKPNAFSSSTERTDSDEEAEALAQQVTLLANSLSRRRERKMTRRDEGSSEEEDEVRESKRIAAAHFATQHHHVRLRDRMNLEASDTACQALAAFFTQGPAVHHQLNINVWLSSPTAVNLCADCDSKVHVLTGIMLQNQFSQCPKCMRRRCLKCREAAMKREAQARLNNWALQRHECRRCAQFPAKASSRGGNRRDKK